LGTVLSKLKTFVLSSKWKWGLSGHFETGSKMEKREEGGRREIREREKGGSKTEDGLWIREREEKGGKRENVREKRERERERKAEGE
jgi:hypothetical protein